MLYYLHYMKRDTGKRALESYRVFPYIAWALTAGFALFVYNITTELQSVTKELGHQTTALETHVSTGNSEADFDAYQRERYRPGTQPDAVSPN